MKYWYNRWLRHQRLGYESLPTIWQELLRTYRQGRWAAFRQASRYMADECVRIGLPQEAAFHAANAFDGDFAKEIGKMLLNPRNATLVDATIAKLLLTANLQRHFCVACELFQVLSDVVPDSLVDRVLSWVLLRCASVEAPEDHHSPNTLAWKTVESLGARASADTAGRIMEVAINHPAWSAMPVKADQFIPVREEIIDAMKETVVALPVEALTRLADAAIPIATDRRNFKDFDDAVSLLSHIAYRSPDTIKAKISAALYPSGERIPPVLMQAAPFFGKEVPNKDGQLDKYAMHLANNIGQIVQHVAKGEEPKPVDGTIMTWTSEKENERLIVHITSTDGVWALARNRRQIPVEACKPLISAILKAISDRDNLLDNKVSLIYCLKGFADYLDAGLATEVFKVLAPIAEGKIEISPDIASAMSQSHPLSRVTVKSAKAEQVIAQALFVLVQRFINSSVMRPAAGRCRSSGMGVPSGHCSIRGMPKVDG